MTSSDNSSDVKCAIGFERHDHASCITDALGKAERICAAEGIRFTPVRRRVLEILLQEHKALGAYEVLDRLRDEGLGSQPPIAYRALEFLVQNGFAHKIERLNAFIACALPGQIHAPAFMICTKCDAVAETRSEPAQGDLGDAARAAGFQIERTVLEAEGVCPLCQDSPQS